MNEKQLAADYSVQFIEDGMIVGLGTGSTVAYMLQSLTERIKTGLNITAVSTSQATTKLAASLGIKITKLNEIDEIDITIDGADQVDENLNGIKGGGGALLHEKIVASHSKKNIWIVDSSKLVKTLGKSFLPVEIIKFGYPQLCIKLEEIGIKPILRMNKNIPFITDENNYIVDLKVEEILNPAELDSKLKKFAGVVETGLFINVADSLVAGVGNKIKIFNKKKRVQTS
jgi:ribose 5-phosphate isomerase A